MIRGIRQFKMNSPYLGFMAAFFLSLSSGQTFAAKVFPFSTEFQIGKIKHILERAPQGIYISVGGDRSFRGTCMAPNATHIYLIDVSEDIIRFNEINIKLLREPTRGTYLKLRWESSYEDWKKRSKDLTKDDFEWWQKNVRDLKNVPYSLPEALNRYGGLPDANRFLAIHQKLSYFYQTWRLKGSPSLPQKKFLETVLYDDLVKISQNHNLDLTLSREELEWWGAFLKNQDLDYPKIWLEHPEQAVNLGQIVDYKTGNYLFDDNLYKRLHHHALKGNFSVIKIDLADDNQLERFLAILKKKKSPITILDLNNLYGPGYIGDKKYKEIVRQFLPLGQDNSLLITMDNYKDYAGGQFQTYIAFTFGNIDQWPEFFCLKPFFDTLPRELLDLINGRIYEKDESPPYQYLLGD